MEDQDSRDTGSMLSPTQSGSSSWEPSPIWEHPDWLVVLENFRYIRDHPEGPPERCSRPYKLQQVALHNQSKAGPGAKLIMDISNVRQHLPEGFSRCSLTAYSPSIVIELAELLYIQPAPADPADSSRVATNLRWILRYLGPPAASIPCERDLHPTQSS